MILVDTNVLLRLAAPVDPLHVAARDAVLVLRSREEVLTTSSQNLIEAWNVSTRPANRNGLGFSIEEAELLLQRLESGFPRLADSIETYSQWRRLVVEFGVAGVQAHDARLVAAMRTHGIRKILTFNTRDFRRYAPLEISPIDPRAVE